MSVAESLDEIQEENESLVNSPEKKPYQAHLNTENFLMIDNYIQGSRIGITESQAQKLNQINKIKSRSFEINIPSYQKTVTGFIEFQIII